MFGTGAALALERDDRRLARAMFLASTAPLAALLRQRLIAAGMTASPGTALCAAALGGQRAFRPAPLVELGKMSCSFHLFEMPVGRCFCLHALAVRGPNAGPDFPRQSTLVVVTALPIRPLCRWLEKPFLRPVARVLPPPA